MSEEIKIVAVVKFNSGEAFVLNRMPELEYSRFGGTIIGTDGTFHSLYEKDFVTFSKAFGGHKFDLTMSDGEVVHCTGQWWDAVSETAFELVGPDIIPVTISTVEKLRQCYVFMGTRASGSKIKVLRGAYEGRVYEYREYEDHLKSGG